MPTLRALECLVAVLDHGSVTEAAASLHLSQPALSHQLAVLERELGTPVVERLPRGVRPTAAGRAVAADARAALAAAGRVLSVGRAVAEGSVGRLRLACAESMTAPLLAPVLRAWHRHRPGVRLTLVEVTSADALAGLVTSGEADLALGPRPTRFDGRITRVGAEEVVAVLPPGDPLADAAEVAWTDLAGRGVVHYHRDNGLGGWLDAVAAGHGVLLDAVTRTRSAATAAQLAHAGLGVALVPTTALPSAFPGALRGLAPRLAREVVVLDPTPSDPLARRFADDLRRRGVPTPKAVRQTTAALPGDPGEGR